MVQLCKELLYEILGRLPAKLVLKFRSVSRQWKLLISHPEFAKTHVNHPSHGPPTSVLTMNHARDFNTIDYADSDNLVLHEFGVEFRYPLYWLCSSCNGLAFLVAAPLFSPENPENKSVEELFYYDFHFLVGNPVLGSRDFLDIPRLPQEMGLTAYNECAKESFNFGFGYVSARDDYCIFLVVCQSRLPDMFVYVYSLKSRQWRSLRTFEEQNGPLLEFEECWYEGVGTPVKETLHWGVTVGRNGPKCIAALDLATQKEITFMELPHAGFGEATTYSSAFRLCCMRGCLCAWERYDGGRLLKMWMMREYGDHKSWSCLFMYDPGFICNTVIGLNESDEGFLLNDGTESMILTDFGCDPPASMHTEYQLQIQAVNYFQSLVSPLAIIARPAGAGE